LVVLVHLPRIVGTAWDSGSHLAAGAVDGLTGGQWLAGVSALLQVAVLAVPVLGILLVLAGAGRRSGVWVWTHTEGRPVVRAMAGVAAGAGLAALLFAWIPPANYQPIRPGERGTVLEATGALRRLPSGTAALPARWPQKPPGSPVGTPPEGAPSEGSTSSTSTTSAPAGGATSTTAAGHPPTTATTSSGARATSSTTAGESPTTVTTAGTATTTTSGAAGTTSTRPTTTTTTSAAP